MNTSSYFIKDKALFGSFPTQESVLELEEQGVRYFVDLTTPEEKQKKLTMYTTQYNYVNYPIHDRHVPTDWFSYAKFIIKICKIIKSLKNEEKLYAHCRGGHGRAGVLVASILCHIFNLSPDDALKYTTKYHSNRKHLKDKWKKIGSPQTYSQKKFIYKFFLPLNFYKTYKNSNIFGFSNFSQHKINIKGIGIFANAEAALHAYKNIEDKEFVNSLINTKSGLIARYLGKQIIPTTFWEENKIKIMEDILKLKIEQNPIVKQNLLNTGLRPLVEHIKYDLFWGDNGHGIGENILGKLLTKLRNKYYEHMEL